MVIIMVAMVGGCEAARLAAENSKDKFITKVASGVSLTNRIDTLTYDQVHVQEKMDSGALYLPDRVISPISPVVVRRDDPKGPTYQEALGYTFLINSVKFPGLMRMDDGRLVLCLTGVLDPPDKRVGLILYSDDGLSWTTPRRMPTRRVTPVNLGGDRLMLANASLWLSDDAGKTWSDPKPIPPLPDGRSCYSDVAYHPLVDGDTVTFLFWSPVYPGYVHWDAGELFTECSLQRYHLDSGTWDEPVMLPRRWGLNEGSLTRGRKGTWWARFARRCSAFRSTTTTGWAWRLPSRPTTERSGPNRRGISSTAASMAAC